MFLTSVDDDEGQDVKSVQIFGPLWRVLRGHKERTAVQGVDEKDWTLKETVLFFD